MNLSLIKRLLDEKVGGDFVDELTVIRCVEDIHKVCMFQFPLEINCTYYNRTRCTCQLSNRFCHQFYVIVSFRSSFQDHLMMS